MSMKNGCNDPECGASTGLHEGVTFGKGFIFESGFFELPCRPCAKAWDELHPNDEFGPAWPFKDMV